METGMDVCGEAFPILELNERLCLGSARLLAYLAAVGGGHPVHTSPELALRAGFRDTPLPGVLMVGAALASLTRHFATLPILLLSVESRFLAPLMPGDEVGLAWRLDLSSLRRTRRYIEGAYDGGCTVVDGREALSMRALIRVVTPLCEAA
ncbi:MaoC family dehydratase [Candidimonas humi]|uniref:Acyl dehydratase n=1 Tax=Candidimonas humi TaxID=683355 RepID=A0ABV8NTN6_9BURK|nr:MaoC family dehydratase [Candidimonas humi]MBV6303775.1 MaoC family dehydratase [Candidimonas humi]